jgi:ribosomal protein S18 acetylase RimI-like enzyme
MKSRIRDHIDSDIDDIIKIYTLEYKAMPEEIDTLRSAPKILVYENHDGVEGFIHLSTNGSHCYIEMGVISNEKIMSIGSELWQEALEYFDENKISSVQVFHVKENLLWEQFFNELNFKYWYSVYRLDYHGQKFPERNINVIKYDDQYYDDKMRLESEAFSVLRQENNIKPYNWYLVASEENLIANRKATLLNKDFIYLFFEGDEMIGASMVKNSEIELLFTNVKYQRKGYGKKILEYSVNKGLEQNSDRVSLNVLAGNEKALKLYMDTGFKLIQGQDCRKLIREGV